MIDKKYALGMGDTDCLSDGVYATLNDAHAAAKQLKDLPDEDGICNFCYVIGEVVPSSSIALEDVDALTYSLTEHLAEQVGELEPLDGIFESYIEVDDAGKDKIKSVLRDVLANHTQYPIPEVLKDPTTFNFADKNTQALPCPYCHKLKNIAPTARQIEGGSKNAAVQCKDCKGMFTTFYNRTNGVLVSKSIRL